MKNVTFRQLRVFEAVANHLSFSRAAEELHLTQPAVSMQVQALAEQAGLPLFEQMGKKIFLTTAGEELLRHARRIAQQLREADEAVAAIRGAKGGRIILGVVSTAKYFAPRILVAFKNRYPESELRLRVHNRETIVRLLEENQIDLAIMGVPPKDFDTVASMFADQPHVIIAQAGHPLAGKRRIEPADLAGEPFLVREVGSGTRGAMERFFAERGVQLSNTTELLGNETIKQAVMGGMGLTFISEHTIGLELAVGYIVKLNVAGTPVMRKWYIVRRADKLVLPISAAFLDFMRVEAPRLIVERAPITTVVAKVRAVRPRNSAT
jgi:LysR family transcriptional regulator, low CO2-responsive transcriptional regulator